MPDDQDDQAAAGLQTRAPTTAPPYGSRTWLVRAGCVGLASLCLSSYAVASLLLTGPLNPLQLEHGDGVRAVTEPFFRQNWQLFAPDPVNVERGLLARVRCADGEQTGFRDLTTPWVRELQGDRFFPSRETRVLTNPLYTVYAPDPVAEALREAQRRNGEPVMGVTPAEQETRREGESLLARAVTRVLADECGGQLAAVQLRQVVHTFPRWSGRRSRARVGDVATIDSAWLEVPRRVAS